MLVSTEDIDFELRGIKEIRWADFWLNPRKLRGSDFPIYEFHTGQAEPHPQTT